MKNKVIMKELPDTYLPNGPKRITIFDKINIQFTFCHERQ